MYDQAVNETAEAICSALHRTDFRHLGDTQGGQKTWFTRGDKPKWLRVEVSREHKLGQVLVIVAWPNVSLPQTVVRGSVMMRVDVSGSLDQVAEASEQAVIRCLEIYRDVLTGTGFAGEFAARSVQQG